MSIEVKICGLGTKEAVAAAVEGGARYVGFVFFPASPRCVTPIEAAALVSGVPKDVTKVGLVVDADDRDLRAVVYGMERYKVGLDMLQLHGSEPPERVTEVKEKFGLPVMKAVAISGPEDLERAHAYEGVADRLLFDAKPPPGATRPGGNALAFDWELIRGVSWRLPWMLAGGIDAANVAEAVAVSGAPAVDVSSGVEDAPGVKNVAKIREFLQIAAGI